MIVSKTLDILNNSYGNIYVLDNKIITHERKTGYFRAVDSLKTEEVDSVVKLLKRNNHRKVSTDWIDYMDYTVKLSLNNLNSDHYYKYYERSRDLDNEDDTYYYVSVFLDNHDWEQFEHFKIPKCEIKWNILDKWLGWIC